MLHEYYIELEIVYPSNSKGNPHDFIKTITHQFWDCDFYIIQKSLVIKKNGSTHEYDLTDIEKLTIKKCLILERKDLHYDTTRLQSPLYL